jgi:hypothetical protein
MTSMKTLGLAIGMALAASSFALAQQGNPPNNPAPNAMQQGSPMNNPAANGTQQGKPANNAATNASGMHQTSQKTGSARSGANHRVVTHPVTGRRIAVRRLPGRRIYAYQPLPGCHFVRIGAHLRKICR